jgi:hypothetical protein
MARVREQLACAVGCSVALSSSLLLLLLLLWGLWGFGWWWCCGGGVAAVAAAVVSSFWVGGVWVRWSVPRVVGHGWSQLGGNGGGNGEEAMMEGMNGWIVWNVLGVLVNSTNNVDFLYKLSVS